ncbi:hypothetical protein HK097_000590 [Rhizophlyctis rosea]|uniref:Uncharacterized protein n=1 Tax=Rhizophlyctis rosea TaxID=64517 RepID=A0AAD5S7X3_9FUNG|nr:hypothetical protein HK097_000590 [Rhizophlyctis rosea]
MPQPGKQGEYEKYEYVNQDSVSADLVGSICSYPRDDPVYLPCGESGHEFCRDCVTPWIRDHGWCPSCRSLKRLDDIRPVPLISIRSMLGSLHVQCKNGWMEPEEVHDRLGQGRTVLACKYIGRKDNIAEHHGRFCEFVVRKCAHHGNGCTQENFRQFVEPHEKLCLFASIPCTHAAEGCTWRDQRQRLDDHVSKDCGFVSVHCKYSKVEDITCCAFRGHRRLYNAHVSKCPYRVLEPALKALKPLLANNPELQTVQQSLLDLQQQVNELQGSWESRVQYLSNTLFRMRTGRDKTWAKQFDESRQERNSQRQRIDAFDKSLYALRVLVETMQKDLHLAKTHIGSFRGNLRDARNRMEEMKTNYDREVVDLQAQLAQQIRDGQQKDREIAGLRNEMRQMRESLIILQMLYFENVRQRSTGFTDLQTAMQRQLQQSMVGLQNQDQQDLAGLRENFVGSQNQRQQHVEEVQNQPDGGSEDSNGTFDPRAAAWADEVDSEEGATTPELDSADEPDLEINLRHAAPAEVRRSLVGQPKTPLDIHCPPPASRVREQSADLNMRGEPAQTANNFLPIAANNQAVVISGSDNKNAGIVWYEKGREYCLHGHTAAITSIAVSASKAYVVTASEDKLAKIWRTAVEGPEGVTQLECLHTLAGHAKHVLAVTLSLDSERVLTGSRDKTVKLWELETGREVKSFGGHWSDVLCVAFSDGGECLAGGSKTGTVKVWDVESGELLWNFSGFKASVGLVRLRFVPGARRILIGTGGGWVTTSDLEEGNVPVTWKVCEGKVEIMDVQVHDEHGTRVLVREGLDVRVFELDEELTSAKVLCSLEVVKPEKVLAWGEGEGPVGMSFNTNGKVVVGRFGDGRVVVWDSECGEVIIRFKAE